MIDMRLILPPPGYLYSVQVKHDFCCRSERVFLFNCIYK